MVDLTQKPIVLYAASIERRNTAQALLTADRVDYAATAYLAGLAVESLLQAFAIRRGSAFDARHSLVHWLSKGPAALMDAYRESDDWSRVVSCWDNAMRYLSFGGLLGYYRDKQLLRRLKGDPVSKVRAVTKALVQSATSVHGIGLALWQKAR